MKRFLLILTVFLFKGILLSQTDSLTNTVFPENITAADITAKEISIDLSNPQEVEAVLKKIHTYKYLESVILEGETDEGTLEKIFYRLSISKNLTGITLRDNEIKKIPDNISGIKTLRSITIDGNENLDYTDLCAKLSRTSITDLNLTDNNLKETPANISQISTLKKIKISGSTQLNYENLIDQSAKLKGLTALAIPVNYITDLPKNITKLASLQVLDVSNNSLTELPDGVSSLKAINNLAIQGNLMLNPAKDLEKFKGVDLRSLTMDKEVSGEDIEKIKKMFPNVEVNFPIEKKDDDESKQNANPQIPLNNTHTGELKTKKESKILSSAYLLYPTLFRGLVYNFDTLGFEERYANKNYTNVYQRLPNGRAMGGQFGFSYYTFLFGIHQIGKNKQKRFWFSSNAINYPELRAFSGMEWVYQGALSKKKFNKNFMKKVWNDIRVDFDKNNSMFSIELKSDTGFEKFNAYPVIGTMPLEKAQQTYARRFIMYQQALSRRAQQFKRNQKKERNRYDANFKKMRNYAWNELQLRMSNEEKLMSREEWLEYYDNIMANEKAAIDKAPLASGYLTRQFTLMGFNAGGQNIPTSANTYQKNSVSIDFIDANGAGKLAVANIITLDNKNKFYTQTSGTLGLAANLIFLNQFSSNLIFVEMRNGNFGVVSSNEIDRQSLLPNKTYEFKVIVFDKNLDTIGNLLKGAGLE